MADESTSSADSDASSDAGGAADWDDRPYTPPGTPASDDAAASDVGGGAAAGYSLPPDRGDQLEWSHVPVPAPAPTQAVEAPGAREGVQLPKDEDKEFAYRPAQRASRYAQPRSRHEREWEGLPRSLWEERKARGKYAGRHLRAAELEAQLKVQAQRHARRSLARVRDSFQQQAVAEQEAAAASNTGSELQVQQQQQQQQQQQRARGMAVTDEYCEALRRQPRQSASQIHAAPQRQPPPPEAQPLALRRLGLASRRAKVLASLRIPMDRPAAVVMREGQGGGGGGSFERALRRQLEAAFVADVARALRLAPSRVSVMRLEEAEDGGGGGGAVSVRFAVVGLDADMLQRGLLGRPPPFPPPPAATQCMLRLLHMAGLSAPAFRIPPLIDAARALSAVTQSEGGGGEPAVSILESLHID
eukprot:COSAG01_NODE_2594_length_7402_cov_7.251951_2_plen_417_part_00